MRRQLRHPRMTREIAWAIALDRGNARMREGGREQRRRFCLRMANLAKADGGNHKA